MCSCGILQDRAASAHISSASRFMFQFALARIATAPGMTHNSVCVCVCKYCFTHSRNSAIYRAYAAATVRVSVIHSWTTALVSARPVLLLNRIPRTRRARHVNHGHRRCSARTPHKKHKTHRTHSTTDARLRDRAAGAIHCGASAPVCERVHMELCTRTSSKFAPHTHARTQSCAKKTCVGTA